MAETSTKRTILILMGSFRKGAFTFSVAQYAAKSFSDEYDVVFPALNELPLFCQGLDDENKAPKEWTVFREQVKDSDAILFVTPEHNRSYPAVLKNALDIASRPAGQSVWAGKPAAIISNSPGRIGGAVGNQHIRQPLTFLDLCLMNQPEMYISDVASLVDGEGNLADQATQRHIEAFVAAFEKWITD